MIKECSSKREEKAVVKETSNGSKAQGTGGGLLSSAFLRGALLFIFVEPFG